MLIIYFQSDYIMSFNIIIKYSFLSYHVTTKGKKCMTLKVVVITTFNINTTKFVTLEFVDKIFTTQKPFLILIIPDFLCLAWHIMLITNFELLSETLFNLCLVSLVSFLFFFLSFSLLLLGRCYVVEAGLEFFGMKEMKDTPTKNRPNFAFISQQEYINKYYNETMDKFVEVYITGDDDTNQLPATGTESGTNVDDQSLQDDDRDKV